MTRVGTPFLLQGVLQGEAVHDRRQHAHVVAGGPVHALGRGREAPEDVAAADDDGDLDAVGPDLADLVCDEGADRGVDAVRAAAEQRLTRDLEQDPRDSGPVTRMTPGPAAAPAASLTAPPRAGTGRTARTRMFSPIVAMASVTSCPTVLSVSRKGCS